MLVVNGPVPADGYDWYEVRADNDLFGWVAAGKDGEDWIAPAAANCTDDLDESALWTVDPIDFFVCYGDTPVSVRARKGVTSKRHRRPKAARRAHTPATTSTARRAPAGCSRPRASSSRRLAHRTELSSLPRTGRSLDRQDRHAPEPSAMTLTVAMDAPQAQNCRIVDDRGRDLISRDEAVTRCRMQFVVRDVASDP